MTVDKENLPRHVAITMDGNGRWATQRKLPRTSGHNEGLKAAKRIVKAAADLGIESLTLYVFSTENWKRAEQEVGFLMNLIHTHLKGELEFYKENKIRINHIGDMSALPKNIQKDLTDCIEDTKDFTKLKLNLAINYGGRDESIRGIKKAAASGLDLKELKEADFSKYLDMPECSDVDLLIRTGGEKRLSNFLLWQLSYAEFYFSDTLWPDFSADELKLIIEDYKTRERRYGKS